jgi:uncharacterized protein (TIGR02270 family)
MPTLTEQHLQNAIGLWERREQACREPSGRLTRLVRVDERLDANLEGLREARDLGWQAAAEEAETSEPPAVFVLGVLAFASGEQGRVERVVELARSGGAVSRAVTSALGWLPFKLVSGLVARLATATDPRLTQVSVAAYAIHRAHPGDLLAQACRSPDAILRSRALRAIGELGALPDVSVARDHLSDPAEGCRFEAARSLAILEPSPAALDVLLTFVASGSAHATRAAAIAGARCRPDLAARIFHERLTASKAWPRALGIGEFATPVGPTRTTAATHQYRCPTYNPSSLLICQPHLLTTGSTN